VRSARGFRDFHSETAGNSPPNLPRAERPAHHGFVAPARLRESRRSCLLKGMAGALPETSKLQHHTPLWVPVGEVFHIRIRCNRAQPPLTDPGLGLALLESVNFYHARRRWWCYLFLLMPDHLHALISFPPGSGMSRVIGEWKRFHVSQNRVAWQEGYFDHRIRNDRQFEFKAGYIRANPVVKNLCQRAEDWPWVYSLNQRVPGGPGTPRAASEPPDTRTPKPSRAGRPTHPLSSH